MKVKLRLQNKAFWITWAVGVVTILTSYLGLTSEDITTWDKLFGVLITIGGNPLVLLAILVFTLGSLFDFSVPWFKDSATTMLKTNVNDSAEDIVKRQLIIEDKEARIANAKSKKLKEKGIKNV